MLAVKEDCCRTLASIKCHFTDTIELVSVRFCALSLPFSMAGSASGDLWYREAFPNGSTIEPRLVANDPLREGVAVRARPVSVGLGEGVVVRGGFNLLCDADGLIPNPLLD
tara:strand:- start:68 stop:400 length:333 start_codon:yes stop_codon:yes gene_type:complete